MHTKKHFFFQFRWPTGLLILSAILLAVLTRVNPVTAAPQDIITVTVTDTNSTPQAGLYVYAFAGTTYVSVYGVTDANGQVFLSLDPGDYNFRADLNGTQFFSGGTSGVNTCTVPGCTTDAVTVTTPVVVTVSDTNSVPQAGLNVYAFSGTTYAGIYGITDINGQVTLTVLPGDYNFRADLNGTQFFSGGSSGVNTCTVPGCTTDAVTVTPPVVVTVADTNSIPQPGLNVYAFNGTTYAGISGVTDANGQASFTLLPGDYNFRADVNGTQFFSGGSSGINTCTVPGCTTDSVTVTNPVVVTVTDTNSIPQPGLYVYAFNGTTYAGIYGITDANGQVSLTLLAGDYNFRADVNGTQFFSGGSSGINTCTVPGCTTDSVTVTLPVVVTVVDTNSIPQAGLNVYAFNGTTYAGISGVTDANGQVSLTLLPGNYNFRADLNGYEFFSGGSSGVDTCTVPGCTTDGITVPLFGSVDVTVWDANAVAVANQLVYLFDSTGTIYLNRSATTGAAGEPAVFVVPAGNYRFASDDLSLVRYFNYPVCIVVGCTAATVVLSTNADLAATKSVNNASPNPGESVVYTLTATNNGPSYATTVVLNDALPAGVVYTSDDGAGAYQAGTGEWTLGTLALGDSAVLHITATVTASPGTVVTNTATLSGAGLDPHLADNQADAIFSVAEYADLSISKTVNNATPSQGTSILYTLVVTNNGMGAATSVLVTDLLPVGVAYGGDDSAGAYNAGTGAWTIGNLANGGIATLQITATITGTHGTVIDNTAVVSATEQDSNLANNTATASLTVTNVANLALAKSVDNASPYDGTVVTYTLIATNNGPDSATNVLVTDILPVGVTYVSDDGAGAYNAGTGAWSIGNLAYGGSATLHITVNVNPNTDGDTVLNTATIAGTESDPNLDDNTATTSLTVRVNDLCATTGTLNLPGGTTLPIWGYTPGDCTRGLPAQLPGPMIVAQEGEALSITLHNDLSEATALYFPGQAMVPDLTGVGTGNSTTYAFIADHAGAYLYEAGLLPNAQHQVAMGLYGALIVRPATTGQAYNDPMTAYVNEAVLVLSEIDPALNNSAIPATFDLRNYTPRYWLINGKAYPDTLEIETLAANKVLLRYLNAGLAHHSMALLGLNQTVIANDGNLLAFPYQVIAETVAPGQTIDAITTIPGATTEGSQFALYDGNVLLHNSNVAGYGGMLTFLTVGVPPVGPDVLGPAVSALTLTPNPSNGSLDVVLAAQVSDVNRGDSNIQTAEYYIDSTSNSPVSLNPVDALDSQTEDVNHTITTATLAGLSTGNHTIFVRGQDALGNWGAFNFIVLQLDQAGPATISLNVSPVASNGTVDVTINATGTDQATGNHNVVAAEYALDGGTFTPVTPNVLNPVVSLDMTIPTAILAGLSDGTHTISIRSQDEYGNWGDLATITFDLDRTGPTTSGVNASPNPNNGKLGFNSSMQVVRVTAGFVDAASDVATAEGFIDTVGADGTGFFFTASDSLFNTPSETGYVDIPLSTILQLSEGAHTIYVHAKDSAGNWGTTSSTILVVDKTLPMVSNVLANPNPTNGNTLIALTATGSDVASPIVAGEWFVGADPGAGNGTAMTVTPNGAVWDLSAMIDVSTWNNGNFTIMVRTRDLAGNWSLTGSTVLVVNTPPPPATSLFYLSTVGNGSIPGVVGPYDNADIYGWDGLAFNRLFDATAAGLPGNANVDGLVIVSSNQFYMSFEGATTTVPGLGAVQDEDVVYYNQGTWSVYFDGTALGLTTDNLDLDAIDISGGVLYFSTLGSSVVPGVIGPADDADIYAWDGIAFSRVFDASTAGLVGAADVDAIVIVDSTHFYISVSTASISVSGVGAVQDEDVLYYNAGAWSVYFDGTGAGLTANTQDMDAFSIP